MTGLDSLTVFALFHAGWFGSIFLARTAYSGFAVLFPLVLLAFLIFKKQLTRSHIAAALGVSIVGALFDSALAGAGFVSISGQDGLVIPVWLIAIWLLFAFAMVKLAAEFRFPLWLAGALGFALGPLSYKSGEAFEVLSFLGPSTFWIYAAFWALAFPAVVVLAKRLA